MADKLALPTNSNWQTWAVKAAEILGIPVEAVNLRRVVFWFRHGSRVAKWAREVANRLGFSPDQQQLLEVSCTWHDVSKSRDPRIGELCDLPRSLTEEEIRIVQTHSYHGAVFVRARAEHLGLTPSQAIQVAVIIGGHHWPYFEFRRNLADFMRNPEFHASEARPDAIGVLDEFVLVGARILSVVDAYDAMTTRRVYNKPKTHQEAVLELMACSESQFDPKIVQNFLAVLPAYNCV